jgi:hypothetical protein
MVQCATSAACQALRGRGLQAGGIAGVSLSGVPLPPWPLSLAYSSIDSSLRLPLLKSTIITSFPKYYPIHTDNMDICLPQFILYITT